MRTAIIEKHGTTAKVLKYFDDLDKERGDEANAIFDIIDFRSTMGNAIKAVTEEGIPKAKALSVLLPPGQINKLGLQTSNRYLSNTELDSILDGLSRHLLYASRHLEKFSEKLE